MEEKVFYRDTWAEIDLDCIRSNVQEVQGLLPEEVEIIAVVKANAYGHGDVQTAEAALSAGATMLAVAFLDEALALRKRGIEAPILVLGASRPEDINIASREKIILTVFQEEWLAMAREALNEDAEISFHIKVDTGMGRIGVRSQDELQSIERFIKQDSRMELAGIYTHFATADELDDAYFRQQLALFNELLTSLEQRPQCIHSSNSAAALRYPEARFNAVRLGIAMYGLTPSLEIEPELPIPLREAFTLHAKIVHVKRLEKGGKVSYGATYEAPEDMWVGTLPIGYADGWIRKLQGQEVLINGKRTPIIGRICMDQCMVKLPDELPVGTTATLIGRQENESISINEIASKLETINYEVPCIISSRVPRMYKQGGKVIGISNPLL